MQTITPFQEEETVNLSEAGESDSDNESLEEIDDVGTITWTVMHLKIQP